MKLAATVHWLRLQGSRLRVVPQQERPGHAQDQPGELLAMLEAFPGCVMGFDQDDRCTYANTGQRRLMGSSATSPVGKHMRELLGNDFYLDACRCRQRVLDSGRPEQSESRFTAPDGQVIDQLVTHFVLDDTWGRGPRYYQLAVDTSALKRLEQERASRAKDAFLARMNHELRTPLNAALGLSQLLRSRSTAMSEADREHLRAIEHSARHAAALIDDAQDMARIGADELPVRVQPLDLHQQAVEAVHGLAALAHEHGSLLAFEMARGSSWAWGDPLRVRQILLNLCSNAIKYNRAGGQARIRVQQCGDWIDVEVCDQGHGLSTSQLAQLFVPFNRLGAEHSTVPGTGIGLAISRELARLMGGDITVDSTPGVGSRFTLRLCAAQGDTEHDTPHADTNFGSLASANASRPATVLYVEDDEVSRLVFQACLQRRPNLTLHMAESGLAALALMEAIHPDLVVLDLHLPDMSGIDLAGRIGQIESLRGTRLALLTADPSCEMARRAGEQGISLVWSKPLDAGLLLDNIDMALDPRA